MHGEDGFVALAYGQGGEQPGAYSRRDMSTGLAVVMIRSKETVATVNGCVKHFRALFRANCVFSQE